MVDPAFAKFHAAVRDIMAAEDAAQKDPVEMERRRVAEATRKAAWDKAQEETAELARWEIRELIQDAKNEARAEAFDRNMGLNGRSREIEGWAEGGELE